MFRKGWSAGVQAPLRIWPDLKPMKALGYRRRFPPFRCGVFVGISLNQRDTRRYAKRQSTWLSRETEAVRVEAEIAAETAAELVKKFLFLPADSPKLKNYPEKEHG
jgi:tRNA A37 N6-isopentenylltransferase MiaA